MSQTLYGREKGGYIVRYEEPSMRVLMLEAEDIITLSNDGTSSFDKEESDGESDLKDWT